MGVSDDTVRRWVDSGKLSALKDEAGRAVVNGAELAAWAKELADQPGSVHHSSARNHLEGLVTAIKSDAVMSQVDLQCGPYRLVSMLSMEAVVVYITTVWCDISTRNYYTITTHDIT